MQLTRFQLRFLLALFAVAAGVWFTVRGPLRMLSDSHDFGTVYAGSRAWASGQDPYDHGVLADLWYQAGGTPQRVPTRELTPSVYPVSTFVLGSPLGVLPWRIAQILWFACNLASIALLLEVLRRFLGLAWTHHTMLLLAAFALALRPFSNAVALGQMSLIVTALGASALLLADRQRGLISGILYGLAMAIKAPVAAAFLVPDLLARRWKGAGIAAIVVGLISVVGLLRLGDPSNWMPHWLDNLSTASAVGGVNDPSPANPNRHQLINLHYQLSTFFTSSRAVNAITWLVAIVLATPALIRLREKPAGAALLLPLSSICVVQLFVGYHRLYDATLLIFPLAWAFLPTTPRRQAGPTLALLLILILPGSKPMFSGPPEQIWWWDRFILPRDAWAVLLLGGWLACCQAVAIFSAKKRVPNASRMPLSMESVERSRSYDPERASA